MEAIGINKNEYWERINAVNRILRTLDSNPNWRMLDDNEMLTDGKYKLIDYFKLSKATDEDAKEFIRLAFGIIDDRISALDIVESKYDFGDVVTNDTKQDESIIINESKRLKRILEDIYKDNSKLLTLEFWEFEEITAELLFKQGYKVELTKKTKDNGYDILAIMKLRMHNPLKFLVQCKRYKEEKVGVDVIRSFKEVINTEKANRGIIVTTSYFTKGALQKQADVPYLLDYRDKDKVIEWVKDYFDS